MNNDYVYETKDFESIKKKMGLSLQLKVLGKKKIKVKEKATGMIKRGYASAKAMAKTAKENIVSAGNAASTFVADKKAEFSNFIAEEQEVALEQRNEDYKRDFEQKYADLFEQKDVIMNSKEDIDEDVFESMLENVEENVNKLEKVQVKRTSKGLGLFTLSAIAGKKLAKTAKTKVVTKFTEKVRQIEDAKIQKEEARQETDRKKEESRLKVEALKEQERKLAEYQTLSNDIAYKQARMAQLEVELGMRKPVQSTDPYQIDFDQIVSYNMQEEESVGDAPRKK